MSSDFRGGTLVGCVPKFQSQLVYVIGPKLNRTRTVERASWNARPIWVNDSVKEAAAKTRISSVREPDADPPHPPAPSIRTTAQASARRLTP